MGFPLEERIGGELTLPDPDGPQDRWIVGQGHVHGPDLRSPRHLYGDLREGALRAGGVPNLDHQEKEQEDPIAHTLPPEDEVHEGALPLHLAGPEQGPLAELLRLLQGVGVHPDLPVYPEAYEKAAHPPHRHVAEDEVQETGYILPRGVLAEVE